MATATIENVEQTRAACHTTSLNILESLPAWKGVKSRHLVEYRPMAQFTHGSVIDFEALGLAPESYIDLSRSRIRVKSRITNPDGTALAAGARVAPVNLTMQSMFSQIDLSLQGVAPSGVGYFHPYKAYLDALTDPLCLQEKFSSQVFIMDDAGKIDSTVLESQADERNTAYSRRAALFAQSKVVEMGGYLCNDMCDQPLYIINQLPLHLKFYPARSEFILLAENEETKYRFEIIDMVLELMHVVIDSHVIASHAEGMKIKKAEYSYNSSSITIRQLAAKTPGDLFGSIFPGETPSEVIIGMVRSDSFNGVYSRNAFNFQDFGCELLDLTLDGRSVNPGAFYTDYKRGSYTNAYLSLFSGGTVSYENYPKGFCLYKYDLGALTTPDCVASPLGGQLKLRVKLNVPLDYAITIVIYGKRPSLIRVSSERHVDKV